MTSRRAVTMCAVISLLMLSASGAVSDTNTPGAKRTRSSDDVTGVSLQTVVEQQASVIQTLQAKLTSLENSLQAKVTSLDDSLQAQLTSQLTKVTSLETNLKALQTKVDVASSAVAFSARFSGDQSISHDGVSMGPHQTLVFKHPFTNVGNAYNSSTGIFTAPVAGTYAFFLTTMSTNTHGPIWLAISKNGATLDLVYAEGQTDSADQGSSLVSAHLVKGDHVWVRQEHGDAVVGGWDTVFTGYLLQAQ